MTMVCGTLAGSRIELASVSPFWRNVMRQAAVIARQAGQGASQAGLGQADKRFAVSGADGETYEDRLTFHKTEQGRQRRQQFEKRVGARRRRLLALLSQFIHPRAEPIERGDIRSGGKGRVGDPLDRPADRHLAEEEFDLLSSKSIGFDQPPSAAPASFE